MRVRRANEEVLFAEGEIVTVEKQDIDSLKEEAGHNARRRIRLCAHESEDDIVHEMFLVLPKGTYIRPAKHLTKGESYHIVEGSVTVVLFDESGNITDVIRMGGYLSGWSFYYRLQKARYHTIFITSDILIFHETTKGPFQKSDTVFAPWAPEESDSAAIQEFMEELARAVQSFALPAGGIAKR